MKTIRQTIVVGIAMTLLFTHRTYAIEGLKVSVQSSNAVLSWPSTSSENYIVQYRPTMNPTSFWLTLTSSLPADAVSNLTFFVHSNSVQFPPLGSGGGGTNGGGIMPPPDGTNSNSGGTNGFQSRTGFYRAVREGIHLSGFTNGMVLSGQVPLRFEFGNADTNRFIDQVFLTDNGSDANVRGSSFLTFAENPNSLPTGVWDTLQTTNGAYSLQLGALLDNGGVAMDTPISVMVSNAIYMPDPWNVGGLAISAGFKTIYTNGTWHLDVYDDSNTYLGYLNGTIDADGNCNYPGIPGPGFSLNNTDVNGNQNPSTAYSLVMAAAPPNTPPPYQVVTNKVFIEPGWPLFGNHAVVCYQQVFHPGQPGEDDVIALVSLVRGVEELQHPNLMGTAYLPFEIQTASDWTAVTNNLATLPCRDFFYFGHGSGSTLGSGASSKMKVSDIQKLLGNNFKDPLSATNRHPYRFVFLDGCNTADGDWPQAFGIPKQENMAATDFTDKRGIRARAFMGWNSKKVVGTGIIAGGQIYTPHEEYIGRFWDYWGNAGNGNRSIRAAIDQAEALAPLASIGMVVYGTDGLVFQY